MLSLAVVATAVLVSPATAQSSGSPAARAPQDPPRTPPTGGDDGAQEERAERQDKVVVTASRREEDVFETPYTADVIDRVQLYERQYRTVPQALRDVPGVMVQETAVGHGSPYIRGFTSFRNLFLVDGIRLNNSVFRPGPNQYWNTVDPYSIERLEIVKGPHSVLFGSDAAGGTVQALTRGPSPVDGPGFSYGGRTMLRYATADSSVVGRSEFDLGYGHADGSSTSVLLGATLKRFDDLEAGAPTNEQPYTGYDEDDVDVKVVHRFDESWRAEFLHQRVDQDEVPRTHRTVRAIPFRGSSVGSDLERSFDQRRRLTYGQLHGEELGGAIDALHLSLSLHQQIEERRRVRGNGNLEYQGFDVDTWGVSLQLESETAVGDLTYGAEWYHDRVDSFLRRIDDPRPTDSIQGPVADDATYDLMSVYLQDLIRVDERLSFTLGGRFNYAAVDADSVLDPVTSSRIGIDDDWNDFVFSLRSRYELLPERWALYGGVSQGFRAPNLSDLTRFDSARTNEFEVPSPGLEPEYYLQYEIGNKVRTDQLSFEGAFFYTDIQDQILRFPTGNTLPSGDNEVIKANVGDGESYGVELGAAWRPLDAWTAFGNLTWLEGRVENFPSAGQPATTTWLTRLMPLTYQVGLRYDAIEAGRWWLETRLIRAEDADKLSRSDRRDTSRIPPGGTPSYLVWDIGGGLRVTDSTDLVVRAENLNDENYRVHGSGQNRPGRNFVFAVQTTF